MAEAQNASFRMDPFAKLFVLFTEQYHFGHHILFGIYTISHSINPLTTHDNNL